jgi:hypothetical protein
VPDSEPLEILHGDIADPRRGPAIAELVFRELAPIIAAIGADEVGPQVPFSDEELIRRSGALASATDRLARLSALAGRWAPIETARLWPQALAALLDVRDRGNGFPPWLEMLQYPALLAEYAFGLGATIGRRYDNLAIVLTAPTPDARRDWVPAALQLNPATIDERVAIRLPGGKPRWPLSDHLMAVARPWFVEMVPSDALFDREFDRFEVILCLVCYDLRRADKERTWAPIGRFARFGHFDRAIHDELIGEGRRDATTSALLDALRAGDPDRLATSMSGFEEHVRRILGQVW